MAEQGSHSADPGRVIQRMAEKIGNLNFQVSAQEVVIEDLEAQLAALKAQLSVQSD